MNSRPLVALAAIILFSPVAYAGSSEAMAFSLGSCAALADRDARLACYDQISAQFRNGVAAPVAVQSAIPPASTPVPRQVADQPPAVPVQAAAQIPVPPPPSDKKSWYNPSGWFGSEEPSRPATPAAQAQFGGESIPQSAPPRQQTTTAQFGSEYLPAPTPTATTPGPIESITAVVVNYVTDPYGAFTVYLDNGQVWRQIKGDNRARFSKGRVHQITISRGALGSYNLTFDDHNGLYKVNRIK